MGFFTSLALAIGAGVAAGQGISRMLSNKSSQSASPASAPAVAAPKSAETILTQARDTASEDALAQRRKRTKTVLTGPRGLLTEPITEKKSLLGQ